MSLHAWTLCVCRVCAQWVSGRREAAAATERRRSADVLPCPRLLALPDALCALPACLPACLPLCSWAAPPATSTTIPKARSRSRWGAQTSTQVRRRHGHAGVHGVGWCGRLLEPTQRLTPPHLCCLCPAVLLPSGCCL